MSDGELKIESLEVTLRHTTLAANNQWSCHVLRSQIELYIAQYRPVGCRYWRTIGNYMHASLAIEDMMQSYETTQHRWHRVLEWHNYPHDPMVLCQLEHHPR